MNNLRIKKEDGKWYWSLITRSGKMVGGSCFGAFSTVLEKVSEAYAEAVPMVGERKQGRWYVKAERDGQVSNHILFDIRQLPQVCSVL